MTPSFAALRLGHAPWILKFCQDSLWEPIVMDIMEVHDPLDEIESKLAAFAHRMVGMQREAIAKLVNRIRLRHRKGADLNVEKWLSLLDQKPGNTMSHYREYLKYLRRNDCAKMLRAWQKEDRELLHESLKSVIDGDRRLQGYFDIGDHIGETMDGLASGHATVPLSEEQWQHVRSGITMLPLREQRAIERFFPVPGNGAELDLAFRTIKKLGRFLSAHEGYLTAKPHWDGRSISYLGKTAQIKVQKKNGVIGIILDAGQAAAWDDTFSFELPAGFDQRSVTDAVHHFNHSHRVVWLTVNGPNVSWHDPVFGSSE